MKWPRVYTNHYLCIQKKTAFMTLRAEWVALNFFKEKKVGLCHSTDFFVCRSKWLIHVSSPVTMRDKKLSPSANLNPHLSAQFCDSRLGFVKPKDSTLLKILSINNVFTLPFDTDSLVSSLLVVTRRSTEMSSSGGWSNSEWLLFLTAQSDACH